MKNENKANEADKPTLIALDDTLVDKQTYDELVGLAYEEDVTIAEMILITLHFYMSQNKLTATMDLARKNIGSMAKTLDDYTIVKQSCLRKK